MKPITFSLLYFYFLSYFIKPAFSEVLQSIVITGNKKTSESAIIRSGQIKKGSKLTTEALETIKENLGRINQIKIKDISFKNGILSIVIEEKWTLFPVPMITNSGSYKNRGLIIYEDNFLGSLGTLAQGISWSNSVFNYLLYFQNESLIQPNVGLKFLLMKKSDYVEFKRFDKRVSLFEIQNFSVLFTPNYLYKNNVFKAGPIFIDKSIYKDKIKLNTDHATGLFFRHHLNYFQVMDVMYEGYVTTFDFYALKKKNSQNVFQNEANINWSYPFYKSFINLGIHGYNSNDSTQFYAKNIGGEEGYRGYDKVSFPISQNIGYFFQYQQHLVKNFFFSPFYEYNRSKLILSTLNGKRINENTIGAGIRYYFKKISIPAVMFDYGRNIEDKSNHFHLNIGVSI